ncbi:dynamin family protein [Campylobacter molothri]|uniref:dynamin family protein n=3 Tax=Campylobacter molothri TaxID=1032242 RepID=UPI001D89C658|nr:dynamin family protein [Campylobacter sp. RM10542]MBZ7929744.1 dynamin family protein [Campylobacter sp. W0067]MBZ7934287.1 dynamin family protein [Campylobacter sp. W0065]MBZ7952149.1 dynamin family protein [Campylobacter sp. RM9939]MBZ7962496.1 dynamin family protein [Campylobacter sp. W0049]MBZ7967298.1 dynamin family protein [Campylobacter sp. RM9756]
MQINILNDFINSYKKAYINNYDDSFSGKIKTICQNLNEPFMNPSPELSKELQEISFSLDKNINIAIIGQFSSGKSSLLNLILKKECLPTGVVPVTFKPTFLHYAKEYFLRVEFEDGSDLITDVENLALYTDQRNEIKKAKNLHIFAPIPLLKKITLIDTPGLNANKNDTLTTLSELKNIHAAIWLSLIDNAGKKSEEEVIRENLEILGDYSICVLNQKDKLNQQELDNVLNYVKKNFSQYFKDIIAISCKEAQFQESYKHSNFEFLIHFLQSIDDKKVKEKFAKRKIFNLCKILDNENKLFLDIFDQLLLNFQTYEEYANSVFERFLNEIEILNHQILNQLKSISEKISSEIFNSIKEKEAYFYQKSTKILTKNLYVKYAYKIPYISTDDTYLSMFYHSESMSKEFKKIKNDIYHSFKQIKDNLVNLVNNLENKILFFKSEFSNIQKDNIFQSDINFSELRVFSNASEEYFLKDFKELLFKNLLELDLFFEKLNLKAFANYENATRLTISFLSDKINQSRVLYELNSSEFTLFYPQKNEIYERVLKELNVYEFENLLIDKPVIIKIIKDFFKNNKILIENKKHLIEIKKRELDKRKSQIIKSCELLKE